MIYLFLIASLLSSAFASRSVPAHLVRGIENLLSPSYVRYFEVNVDDPEFLILAHRLTIDLLQSAEEARKRGTLIQGFRLLRLANHLFPHRADVSQKFNQIADDVVIYLNQPLDCDDLYAILLLEIKDSFPSKLATVEEKKCASINQEVRDVNEDIKESEERFIKQGQDKNLKFLKDIKESLTGKIEGEKIMKTLMAAYLGNILLRSTHFHLSQDGSLTADFQLIRKESLISFKGLKDLHATHSGLSFDENKTFSNQPVKMELRLIMTDEIRVYPLEIKIKNLRYFDIWLKTMNLFSYGHYPLQEIAHQNDPHSLVFSAQGIKVGFVQSPHLFFQMNQLEILHLPHEITKKIKKIDMVLVND